MEKGGRGLMLTDEGVGSTYLLQRKRSAQEAMAAEAGAGAGSE